jgi:threonyl-tRNA synthetase
MDIKLIIKNFGEKYFQKGITPLQIIEKCYSSLKSTILAVEVDSKLYDFNLPIEADAHIEFFDWQSTVGKKNLWHSTAHLMAEAIEIMYPDAKFTIGPAIQNGFYYDIDFNNHIFDSQNLELIERKMLELAKQNNPYLIKKVSKLEAINFFKEKNNKYKLEIIDSLNDGEITFYKQGNFVDLCKGPHIMHTGFIKAVKLLNVSGAYWKGDTKNNQLTRIYGISFSNVNDLNSYLTEQEEIKKRDHQKIGKELELFTFSKNVGVGLPLWLPRGTALRERLVDFLNAAQKEAGYHSVVTPHIAHKSLYIASGHYEKYGADSFAPITTPHKDEEFMLKPMNCPHHCEIYKTSPKSYKDLPLRLSEFGTVYRYEQHGELRGIARTRGFTQDDAHIFCTNEQVKQEFKNVIDLVLYVFKTLELSNFTANISLRDSNKLDKYIGNAELWNAAENSIKEAAYEKNLETKCIEGEAAFYGPKLDFMVKDAIGREWQLGTVQLDYQLPIRLKLEYRGRWLKTYSSYDS